MTRKHPLLALAIGCAVSWSASADVVTYSGNTNGGPTYYRATIDSTSGAPTGTATSLTSYNAYTFTVGTSGVFSFATAGAFDTFATLYAGSFTAGSPVANVVVGNDDLTGGIGTSGFAANLQSGTSYTYVVSAFHAPGGTNPAPESGYFSTSITGDGTITPKQSVAAVPRDPRVATFSGTTTGASTYDRKAVDSSGNAVGTAVGYRTFSFTVGAIGSYAFLASGDYDTYLSLYKGVFDPTQPSARLFGSNDDAYNGQYNDDFGGYLTNVSAFAADLMPGALYTLVTSGYANRSVGFFSDAITGPGAITAVPEPGVPSLLLAGGLLVAVGRRRRAPRGR